MYDFEFDARKFRAASAMPIGRRLIDDEFSAATGNDFMKNLRSSVGRSLSVARDVIRESSVDPSSYYNSYATARRDRLNQIREQTIRDFDDEVGDYLRSPSKRYYSYSVAPRSRDTGRGFWMPYYSYPYTSLLAPSRSRLPSSIWDNLASPYTPSWRRDNPPYGGAYYRPAPSEPRKSYYTPRTYEIPSSTSSLSSKPFNRYSHYYIPKHYPGTPMVGGYLFPAGGSYGWRY